MVKIYGNKKCIDCRECVANFDKFGLVYEYVDIFESIANLKAFLRERDARVELFSQVKAFGGVGIPLLVGELATGDEVATLDWEGYLRERGYGDFVYETSAGACSLDGKGC